MTISSTRSAKPAITPAAAMTTARTLTRSTCAVSDDDGGSDTAASSVHVDNVAPTADLGNNGPVDEGSPATDQLHQSNRSVDALTPPPASTTAIAQNADPDLAETYGAAELRPTSATLTFNAAGTYTVYGRIFDKDGGFTDYTTDVTVDNVAPQNVEGGNEPDRQRGQPGQPERQLHRPRQRRHPHLRLARGRRQRPDHHQRHRPELQLHAHRQRQLCGDLHRH